MLIKNREQIDTVIGTGFIDIVWFFRYHINKLVILIRVDNIINKLI